MNICIVGKIKKKKVSCTHSHVVPKLYDEYFYKLKKKKNPPTVSAKVLKEQKKYIKQAKKVL